MKYSKALLGCSDFECIFKLVKKSVSETLDLRRGGIVLGLSDLPNNVGGLHQIGSNFIIMNRKLLELVTSTDDKLIINSYVFHILLHEYIHSLGHVEEQETQILTHKVSERMFGDNHIVTRIAKSGIGPLLQIIGTSTAAANISRKDRRGIEIVKDVDTDNLNYFG